MSGTLVLGNTVGALGDGSNPLGNLGSGIYIHDDADDNTIGGTVGSGGNVISANGGDGIQIENSDTNLVLGNNIQGNGQDQNGGELDGIYVGEGASNNTIGGRWAVTGNDIYGNVGDGVHLDGDDTNENQLLGNLIGLSIFGLQVIDPNGGAGVFIEDGASDNTIGGASLDARNVISGNSGDGVHIEGSDTSGEVILGNAIGTDYQGVVSDGNEGDGISVVSAADNTIGGVESLAGNDISFNSDNGIDLDGASGTLVVGNNIGSVADGTTSPGNGQAGVLIENGATENTIGGTASGELNVISRNIGNGVRIEGKGTSQNEVLGNRIGTDADGSSALGLQANGVFIGDRASKNTIGGTVEGSSNIIMGNAGDGVLIQDPGTESNLIVGNDIGTNGVQDWGNGSNGVFIGGGASDNIVGGTTADEANLIGGNTGDGVHIEDSDTSDNVVEGNDIGTSARGLGLGNLSAGVFIGGGASDNTIGGTTADEANVITDNGGAPITGDFGDGVVITGDDTNDNLVAGDSIGPDPLGIVNWGNAQGGVLITAGASSNDIEDDVISANGGSGIELSGPDTSENTVEGNTIGLNAAGTVVVSNAKDGVLIDNGATDNTVGGTTADEANVIAGNVHGDGVDITGSQTSDNVVTGNDIGTTAAGATLLGNKVGVAIIMGASDNTIGGTAAGAGNVIADNAGDGVVIGQNVSDKASDNAIEENSIFANGGLGIDIKIAGSQASPLMTGAVTLGSQTTITGTAFGAPKKSYRIEFFSNPAGTGQGKTYLGFVEVATSASGSGSFTFTPTSALSQGVNITATATDSAGNTSEFSLPVTVQLNVTSKISVKSGGLVYNRTTRQFSQTLTITNVGGTAIVGPIELVLQNLNNGSLVNASGTSQGSPYITDLSSGTMGAGQTLTITLIFADPTLASITYAPEFLAGSMPEFD